MLPRMFVHLSLAISALAMPLRSWAEPGQPERGSVLLDLELGYRGTQIDWEGDTLGPSSASIRSPADRNDLRADGLAAKARIHVPIEAIRGTAFIEIGGVWSPDSDQWADEQEGIIREERTRLRSNGSASVAAGFRWGTELGPTEIGFRPYGGLSWAFHEVEVRSDVSDPRFFDWLDDYEGKNRFVTTSAIVGANVELFPFRERFGFFIYGGGGYEFPLWDTRELAKDTTEIEFYGGSFEFGAFGVAEIRHSWFLETGVGWRFDLF